LTTTPRPPSNWKSVTTRPRRNLGSQITVDGSEAVRLTAVPYQVGGRKYPIKTSPSCLVCMSDLRIRIENAIIKGYSVKSISEALIGREESIPPHVIQQHIRGQHMPLDETIRRVALEERNRELGVILSEVEGSIVDHIGVLRAVQQRGYERMAMGEIEPTLSETLVAAKTLAGLAVQDGGTVDAMAFFSALHRIMQVIQEMVSHEQFQHLVSVLQDDPILKALEAKNRSDAIEAQVAEADDPQPGPQDVDESEPEPEPEPEPDIEESTPHVSA